MESKVSVKNTKNQIMDAYNDLLKKLQGQKSEEPKKVQEQQQKMELTDKAKSMTNQGIIKGIAELKVGISSELDKLGEMFITEQKKFDDLQKAISIEKQNLEDLYQLSANTDSLAAMMLAQKEQKEKFEQGMAQRESELSDKIKTEKEKHETEILEKRALWKKEQSEQDAAAKEKAASLKKEREREEEEYLYSLKLNRKKESDQYEEEKQKLEKELTDKKAAFEKEFRERTAKIEEAEAELNELRKKNAEFPKELERAVNAAVKETSDKLNTEHKFEIKLRDKEVEGELKLKDQTIGALSSKIKEIEASIKEMSQKTATAESSVKDIAMKAIESASKPYYFEKKKENPSAE